jgi:UDP-N-acetylmuramoyl-tripeptide--D-alanyl-D-alanine ligase
MATPIPKNHASFTIPEILEATGGSVLTGEGSGVEVVTGVSTDTRALDPGAAFVAIRGATFDGHDHLKAAQAAGSSRARTSGAGEPSAASGGSSRSPDRPARRRRAWP